jgi:hypothetical protein
MLARFGWAVNFNPDPFIPRSADRPLADQLPPAQSRSQTGAPSARSAGLQPAFPSVHFHRPFQFNLHFRFHLFQSRLQVGAPLCDAIHGTTIVTVSLGAAWPASLVWSLAGNSRSAAFFNIFIRFLSFSF